MIYEHRVFLLLEPLNFGITLVMVSQLEVYYKLDRLLTGLTAQQKGTTARWYSNKTSLYQIDRMSLKSIVIILDHSESQIQSTIK